jgi:acyl phosphate:glycerol-3-phosphate acyltransferase
LELAAVALLAVGAYLVGSFPTAYLVVRRLKRRDIRTEGSKNVGALNTFNQAGLAGAAVVLAVDASKGALAVLAPQWVGAPEWALYLTAVLAVAGHNWPVFLKFRGGKGVATAFGIALVILPYLTLIALVPTILLVILTRNMIIGVGVGFVIVNALAVATGQSMGLVALCVGLTAMVVGTYVVGTWGQIYTAIRNRRLRGIFYGPNFNP